MSILGELKRRKVVQVAAVYAVVAWLLVQIVTSIEQPLNLPGWVDTFVIVLLGIGFPIALILSWAFDVTPEGIRATKKSGPGATPSQPSATTFTYVVQGLVLLAVGFLVVDKYVLDDVQRAADVASGGAGRPSLVTRFVFDIPADQVFLRFDHSVLAIAPDSRHFVYRTGSGLHLRPLNELEPRLIVSAERSIALFSSPDGEAVAYWDDVTEQIKRIAISGGAPAVIAGGVKELFGASWGADGTILFAQSEGIFRVAASGDAPAELIIPVMDSGQAFGPQLLPDGDSVIFSIATPGSWDDGEIVVESISTNDRRSLIAGGTSVQYLPTGHLVYALDDRLFAVAFDLDSLTISGQAIQVVEGVIRGSMAWMTGVAQFDVSDDGTLAYVTGDETRLSTLVWVDRNGQETSVSIEPGYYNALKISPLGTRVVINVFNADNDILIWDFAGETRTRLALGRSGGDWPVWTPDGERIAYHPSIGPIIDWRSSNNIGSAERLASGGEGALDPFHPEVFSPSGAELVFHGRATSASGNDIGMVTLDGSAEPVWLLRGTSNEWSADISPNGRWLAYHSDESGRNEIYVRPFPNVDDNRWQISNRGGLHARWSRDGRELFFLEPGSPGRIIAVDVTLSNTDFSFGERHPIIDWPYVISFDRSYDVSLDGKQFLALKTAGNEGVTPKIIIVQNWFDELQQLVPTE